nr:DUF4287 domain-containing protein [Burkholderiales bacterium]
MADPKAAVLTQLRNIQTRTGKSIAELHAALAAAGLAKHAEKRAWLMTQFQLGYGDANTVVHVVGAIPPELEGADAPAAAAAAAPAGDPLEAIYTGPKASLRPLHDAVLAAISKFGPFEIAPKKTYVSLRRARQFAMVGPATREAVEIGLNHKSLPAHARLKALPAGGMCQATTR